MQPVISLLTPPEVGQVVTLDMLEGISTTLWYNKNGTLIGSGSLTLEQCEGWQQSLPSAEVLILVALSELKSLGLNNVGTLDFPTLCKVAGIIITPSTPMLRVSDNGSSYFNGNVKVAEISRQLAEDLLGTARWAEFKDGRIVTFVDHPGCVEELLAYPLMVGDYWTFSMAEDKLPEDGRWALRTYDWTQPSEGLIVTVKESTGEREPSIEQFSEGWDLTEKLTNSGTTLHALIVGFTREHQLESEWLDYLRRQAQGLDTDEG